MPVTELSQQRAVRDAKIAPLFRRWPALSRFELRQLRPGAERAELAAVFDAEDPPGVAAWLATHDLGAAEGQVLLRRTLDAQGRSRAWINGRPN